MRPLTKLPGPTRDAPTDDVRQRLRDLPCETQPPYDWTEFRRREGSRVSQRRNGVRWEHAAAAAGITALIASMAMLGRSDQQHAGLSSSGVTAAHQVAADATSKPAHVQPSPPAQDSASRDRVWSMDELNARINAIAQARAAEASLAAQAAVAAQLAALAASPASKRWLEEQPAEPALVRVGPRLAVANLEDRIAWVDDALTDAQFTDGSAAGMRALRDERARLVGSLAQVRYAETLAGQLN